MNKRLSYIMVRWCVIAVIALITASHAAYGGAMSDSVIIRASADRGISIIYDGNLILGGIWPAASGISHNLSGAPGGNIVPSKPVYSGTGSDAAGEFDQWFIPWKAADGAAAFTIEVRHYLSLRTIAVAYTLDAGMPVLPQQGSHIAIASVPGWLSANASYRSSKYWTSPAFPQTPAATPENTQFLLWQDTNTGYGTLLPLVGGGMKTAFRVCEGTTLCAAQSSGYSGFRPGRVPVFAYSWGGDPYAAVNRVFRAAMAFMDSPGKLRTEKPYPEIFDYIGWCSWNAFYKSVDERQVIDAASTFKNNGFPVGFFIVDDGWQDVQDDRLAGFGINKSKFPSGLNGLTGKLKKEHGIRWVGFWHAYQGYWSGIKKDSPAARQSGSDALIEAFDGRLSPNPVDLKGQKFFDLYHTALKSGGADFVKVDNQCSLPDFVANRVPVGDASRDLQLALQNSLTKNFSGVGLNCMDMSIENVFFWRDTNISRSSDDFYPDRAGNAELHAAQNIYNSLWFSNLAYPDFDMFQSHHPQAGMHAILRAISGGPVYVTDTPGRQDWGILRSLVYSDGRILRADQPALPTRDVLTRDPSTGGFPLKAFTRARGAGIVAAFNADASGRDVTGKVSPSDVNGLKGKKFIAYEYHTRRIWLVDFDEPIRLMLRPHESALFTFIPVENCSAAIGLADKFLSHAAVIKSGSATGFLSATLREGGEFAAYIKGAPKSVFIDDAPADPSQWTYSGSLFTLNVPRGASPVNITVTFVSEDTCDCTE